ncbi:Substrate-specific component CbiM of cobalt ECF transporter [Methanosarcina barkeri str. Wiesmoor]|uniref:Putative cobalt transport protein CbiM 1 n=2 Tax=Methanosarcina barkeri TaxID=2208 RepID=CBIM1_METBF|nr:energy-coupling factor ABC transporter permease [Methanosarcina barkeri]Q46D59.1 RecName: Full=Putative cobalt transport protein CbiM 1; AltName: Full=Energy-coupling factor transporter probable substrate-capture protein CbiM 1; Short=ECF transporter S component CbiM 1 [Methanosarcina barkeri str. Fusaro]AKB52761.1 Substrate-specific component CbiM of cobalt ECF transporter [Methanosarcina barkeri str. Wiesmoor]
MHIFEGFLPGPWWQIWWILSIPVFAYGIFRLNKLVKEKPEVLPLIAVSGAVIFVLSSLKLPSVTGSTSHPTGTGMAVILFGPAITSVLSAIVLLYQALFLAHGGITTFGANLMSMGIIGPFVAYAIYKTMMRLNVNFYVSAFVTATLADWVTYVVTSTQLALAFPANPGGVEGSLVAFLSVFAITQIPLAILEASLITLLFKYVLQAKGDLMVRLDVLTDSQVRKLKETKA